MAYGVDPTNKKPSTNIPAGVQKIRGIVVISKKSSPTPQATLAPLKSGSAGAAQVSRPPAPTATARAVASIGKENIAAKASAQSESAVIASLTKTYNNAFSHAEVNTGNLPAWSAAVTNAVTFAQTNADGNANLSTIAQAADKTSNALVRGGGKPAANIAAAVKKISDSLAQVKPTTPKQKSAVNVMQKLMQYLKLAAT